MPVTTGIVGDPCHTTIVTDLDVAAECGGAAGGDRAHHPLLDTSEMTLMGAGVGGTMTAQDAGDFQHGLIDRVSSVSHGSAYSGGITSRDRRSSGLCVARIVWEAT